MNEKKCPMLMSAWLAKYGVDTAAMEEFCYCGDDCAWYSSLGGCVLQDINLRLANLRLAILQRNIEG